VLFIGMLVYAEIAYGRVFHLGTMSSLLVSFAPTIILAVAMTIVILSGGIDLSVGAVVAFTSVAGVMLMDAASTRWLAIVIMIVPSARCSDSSRASSCSTSTCSRSSRRSR
jgi:simple sugar transport system permease protein